MSLLKEAICLAATLHDGQTDKGGKPYILHPLRIMLKCETNDERIVAILHDVVEDTELTIEKLYEMGFPDHIVDAVDCLTKRKKETYDEYIERIGKNELARKVKMLDLEDNMDLSRLKKVTEKDLERLKKYTKALAKLKEKERRY